MSAAPLLSSPTPFFLLLNPNKPSSLFFPSIRNPNNGAVPLRRLVISARAAEAPAPVAVPALSDDLLDISKLGISDQIVSSLARRGITQLFPIQRAVLEPAMKGRDMIGRAITGSGKTLAFGIPILDTIIRNQNQHRKNRVPSALVLAPTRELARQVQREFKISAPNLSSTCLYGGVPIMSQVRDLRFGMDIVVGTPGRIIDLVERGTLDLSEVQFVVLDEADQMLAIGFQEAVECILSHLPSRKQCMLFSATMPSWVNDLSRKFLKNPLLIDLVGDSEQKLADGISLYSVSSSSSNKQNLLPTLISRYAEGGKSIIFTRTKKDAESLSVTMGSIVGSRALHGNMQQFQRDKTLAAFRDGRFSVLVATDVAARGLDIPNVDLVVHFELPNTSEIFVHRSGRTGRAGNKGTSVLMFTESQRRAVRTIERDLDCRFEELRGLIGRKTELSDSEEYSDSVGLRDFRRPGQFSDHRPRTTGNYGRYQGQATTSRSRYLEGSSRGGPASSRYLEGSSRGGPASSLSGKNHFVRKSSGGGYNSETRRNQFHRYEDGDFGTGERNTRWSTSSASRRTKRDVPDDFDDILDLFKDQY